MERPVKYYSTNGESKGYSFSEALLEGLAPDGGLFLPDSIPVLTTAELKSLSGKEYSSVAFEVLHKLIGDEIEARDLQKICNDAYNFDVPLENVYERKYIMRLDQGPTASFKDFAARLMSRLMQHFLKAGNKYLTILTATSGDTGSAVANAFYGLENIKVIILYPLNEVTPMQRKQMTTLQKNITVIAVDGKFDDCQDLVKRAFMDPELEHLPLSSANSINIGRLLPQTVYYFYAWSKLAVDAYEKVIFSVPSGNFGNLTAGLLASKMGLPVKKFIASTNENDEVPEFLKSGRYRPVNPSRNCLSSAMNVGHPSNLSRIIALYGGIMNEKGQMIKEPDLMSMQQDIEGISVSDAETKEAIAGAYRKYKILLEPHGAIALRGVAEYFKKEDHTNRNILVISLETAHPAKFPDELRKILNFDPPLPSQFEELANIKESFLTIENNYLFLKEILKR